MDTSEVGGRAGGAEGRDEEMPVRPRRLAGAFRGTILACDVLDMAGVVSIIDETGI
jgi:hypothetical protein